MLVVLGNRIEKLQASRRLLVLATLATVAFYFCLTLVTGFRHLWHDELFTYYIAKAPSWPRFWQELRVDLNPPLNYVATRASLALFGDHEYAARLPSAAGFITGSLCLCWFVAQRLGASYGFLAMFVFWSTPFFYYATEARPYGLIFGFFGLAMAAWHHAIQPQRKPGSVLALFAAVLAMMATHFFALFFIGPFGLAELIRQFRARKIDWLIWPAILLPTVLLLVFLRIITGFQTMAFPPVFQAGPRKIWGFFENALTPESPVLLVALALALLASSGLPRTAVRKSLTAVDLAFCLGLFLLPVVINFAIMRSHGAYFDRYCAPAAFLFGILFAALLYSQATLPRTQAVVASGVILIYLFTAGLVLPTVQMMHNKSAGRLTLSPGIDSIAPDLPLVAASGLTFLEADHYEDPATVGRLYYLTDAQYAIQYAQASIFEGLPNLKKYFPIRATVSPYRQFIAEHRRFLVLGTPDYAEDWLLRHLLDIHATVRLVGSYSSNYKDAQLFDVTMPASE